MVGPESEKRVNWKNFLAKHRIAVAIFVVAAVLAFAGSVYVFFWFAGNAQSTGLVPSILGFWTVGNLVAFILNLIFWELLIIGIPVLIGAVVGWQWWKRLPVEEKGYYFFRKRSRTTSGSGGISLFFFIAFCIKVYIDGKWNVPISSWTLNYVVDSMILILVWTVIIFAIPAFIGIIWWINREMKKKP
jgi:hypothetical protein